MFQGTDRPNTTPIGQDRKFKDQSFALTSTSFKDLHFLYEIRLGFLKILLGKGWFCIICHLFIRTCLRLGIDRRYSVTNGKNLLGVYFGNPAFFAKIDFRSSQVRKVFWITSAV